MSSEHRSYAWVTQAFLEHDVEKALVLGKSFRRVFTRKCLVVIVRQSIPEVLRDVLETTFDFVLSVDEGKCRDLKGLSCDSLAKAYILSFTFFDKCIFLNPASLVLKNCDELFDDIRAGAQTWENGKGRDVATIWHLKPSQEAFKKMVAFLVVGSKDAANEKNKFDEDDQLEKWISNNMDYAVALNVPYCCSVGLQEKQFLKNDDDLVIVHLKDLPVNLEQLDPEKNGFKNAGLLEKFIYLDWLNIYKNEVKNYGEAHLNGCRTLPQLAAGPGSKVREPIAVIGMSCRHPASNNISQFWDLLIEGRDGIRTPPDYRWTKEHSLYKNPDVRNTQAGFLDVPVDEFDAKFFGISPKEVIFMDPQYRLLHEVVWEALEDAGVNPFNLQGSQGGVFLGTWRNDYQDILQRSQTSEFYRGYMGNSIGAGAARISHLLGLTGPCIATESGCSAAMVATHMAVRSLQNGESNMALACGVNLLLHPFRTDIMPMVTATDGHCKTFDANADGFGRAEGCAVLVLKRLSNALKDGDRIWGLVRGTAIAQEGISKSMGTPTVTCEAQAMHNALQDANVDPAEVNYVETHGTGTIVGDPLEVAAIGRVYGTDNRKAPLVIGSVKTNVGHTESCSGITGIMKVILSMWHEVIPPHRNFKELNPEIDLTSIPARLPLEPVKWPKAPGNVRLAGVSSFGITGTDGHVISQEPLDNYFKQRVELSQFERPLHIMKITARTEDAFDLLLEKYKALFGSGDSEEFANIAFTANVGRASFSHRAVLIASDFKSASDELDSCNIIRSKEVIEDASASYTGNICFLFTGQGSQYHGMAKQLYETCPVFRMHFDHCENFLWKRYKLSMAEIFWGQHETKEVHRTLYSQTAIFVVEYCLMELWKSWGIKPNFVLGHSLGEFCAAVCAGILTLKNALTLVVERSRLIDQLPGGKMLVVKADEFTVKSLIEEFLALKSSETWLDYAAINSNEQTVLAGDSDTVTEFAEFLQGSQKAVKCSILQSTHAFHSRHMEPMLKKYRQIAEKITYNKSDESCTFVSGMLGKILNGTSTQVDANYWVQHTRERVQFLNASKVACNEGGCRTFLEIGPHPVLMTLTMWNNEGKNMLCLPSLRRNEENWRAMLTSLGKLFPDWERFDQFYQRKKVGHVLPHYPFIGTKCWPNITSHHGTQIHPLLGSAISNPTHTKLFHSQLNVQEVEYLKDHVIGNMMVFPGAGYIEMLLTAGFVTLEGVMTEFRFPRRPIVLQNFRIEAPLGLEEGGQGCQCQTVVNYDAQVNSDEYDVKIYHELRNDEGGSEWVRHASGSFLFSGLDVKKNMSEADNQLLECDAASYLSIIEAMKSTCKEESISKEFYDKTEEVGLKFGPSFRTLQKVWRKDKKDFLAEVGIPKDNSSYLLHPTLIDAMIQVAVFHSGSLEQTKVEKKLRVPIACEKFIWLKPLKTTEPSNASKTDGAIEEASNKAQDNVCYIYSTSTNPKTIMMLDKEGGAIAALVGVEVIETNVKTIKAMLETQVKALPDFYLMDWKPTTCPNNRADFSIINIRMEVLADQHFKLETLGKDVAAKKSLDTVSCYYITNAFLSLGWSPKMNDKVRLDDFCKELGILPQHKQLMRQFLIFLQEDGILETVIPTTGNDIGERQWTVRTLPASKEELISRAEETIRKYCMSNDMSTNSVTGEFLLLRSVGENLDKILTGNESALKILFPEEESKPSAAKFYHSWYNKVRASLYGTWCSIWKEIRATYEEKSLPMPTFKMLEIGAGTGSGTEILISSLEDSEVPYEYVFTDISRAFFASTEKKFEKSKKSMKFRTLNIEQDPSSQGFPPKYFDFVFAADVLHATRDIRESLINIRQVLRDRGYLWLSEIPEANRVVDCTFGLLEGYWRFTDFELRPHHPLPSQEKWMRIGKEMGFSEVAYRRNITTSVISCRADHGGKQSSYEELSKTLNLAMKNIHKDDTVTWLIFHDGTELDYVVEMKARLELLGRKKIILVRHSSSQDFTGEEFLIRPDTKQDMDDLFDLLFKSELEGRDMGAPIEVEGLLVCWGLNGTVRDQAKIAQPFLYLLQNLIKLKKKLLPQLVLLTSVLHPVGDICCENPSGSSLIGIIKSAVNEHADIRFKGIDVNPTELQSNAEEIFQEIFNCCEDQSLLTAYRGHVRHVTKLVPDKFRSRNLPLPVGTDRFQLIHPKSRSIQDLEFGDLPPFALQPDEIEIRVKCFALNFKDVFTVLKPVEAFERDDQVGFDFSGVVTQLGSTVTQWKVGDAVVGINLNKNALPSHLHLPQHAVKAIPSEFTFAESACFPAVFATAHICLVKIAKMKEGETLLIHAASGGVGLVAIQLAKYFGVKIIATAGSHRKRAYLRSIGIQNVFHSRNTSYKHEILNVTNGHGVDIVLNSLTGPGFKEATLDVLSEGGRFVEMSKLNTWTEEEVSQLRPDVEYTIVDLTELDEKTSRELLEVQGDFIMKGNLKAIPYTRFDAVDVRDALTYLQKAQHIGKVVCVMPEEQKMDKANSLVSQFTPLFNDRSTYMITGGLGGIGMEVCKYMVDQGAKHVVLVGRTAPTEKSVAILDNLRKNAACNITVLQADVGDWTDCQRIFQEIDKLPPLRGVMHAAGKLSDGLIENQTWANFQHTFHSKVDGSWNLHQLTKDKVLEHFVLFSSIASTLGSPGQASHVSACAFEDGLAHFRNSHGLTATTINWGQF